MKTDEVLINRDRMSAKLAKQFVDIAIKTYVAEDVEKAVEKLIQKFSIEVREQAKQELQFRRMKSVNPAPKTGTG